MHAWRLLCTVLAAHALLPSADAAILERSTSSSRQFIVYSADTSLRRGLCDLAERTKKNLLAVLQQRDEWKTPIVVHAERRAANLPEAQPARLNFSQTGFGLKLQLDLAVAADEKVELIEQELARALLLEFMYRNAPNTLAGTVYVQPPDWLLEGMLMLARNADTSSVSKDIVELLEPETASSLAEFLAQRAVLLDSPSLALFRVKAAAFIALLAETADGRARLGKFISSLPAASNDSLGDLSSHFPELTRPAAELPQKWTAAMRRLAARDSYRMLTCVETEQELVESLTLQLATAGSPASYTLEEFQSFIRSVAAPAALHALDQRLLLLSSRANPIYAPILAEYRRAAALLARRKTHQIAERLARLRSDRDEISRRMVAIDDYINWFEATQTHMASGAFAEYMRCAELAAGKQLRRRDAISVYLDVMETQFQH